MQMRIYTCLHSGVCIFQDKPVSQNHLPLAASLHRHTSHGVPVSSPCCSIIRLLNEYYSPMMISIYTVFAVHITAFK